MSALPKTFWGSPVRYLRWASHEKPAIFWSVVLGLMGPLSFAVIPPLRRYVGDEDPPRIPLTYPGKWLASVFSLCFGKAEGLSFLCC